MIHKNLDYSLRIFGTAYEELNELYKIQHPPIMSHIEKMNIPELFIEAEIRLP